MLRCAFLACILLSCAAVEHSPETMERFTLTDGRVLEGWYDHDTAKLTLIPIGNARSAAIHLPATQIAARVAVNPPSARPASVTAAEATARERAAIDAERRRDLEERAAAVRVDEVRAAATRERERQARQAAQAWAQSGFTFDPAAMSAEDMSVAVDAHREAEATAARAANEADEARKRHEAYAAAEARRQDDRLTEEGRRIAEARRAEAERIAEERADKDAADRVREQAIARAQRNRAAEIRARFILAAVSVLALIIMSLPSVIAARRCHRFAMQIHIVSGVVATVVLLPTLLWLAFVSAAIGYSIVPPVVGTALGIVCLIAWTGMLVWATWPGVDGHGKIVADSAHS